MQAGWLTTLRGIAATAVGGMVYAGACTNDYAAISLDQSAGATSSGIGGTTASASTGSGASGGGTSTSAGGRGGASGCGGSLIDCGGECVDTETDPSHCGECGHACDTTRVALAQCVAGTCKPICEDGWGDCTTPPASQADDGCEVNLLDDDDHCGSCKNACAGNLNCKNGLCSCQVADDCSNGGMCSGGGTCECNTDACQPGEYCKSNDECSCNGASGCQDGWICCQTPSGCKDKNKDPDNCGACGRRCPPPLVCKGGKCECATNEDCNGPGSGCDTGTCKCNKEKRCVCSGNACGEGQVCIGVSTCG